MSFCECMSACNSLNASLPCVQDRETLVRFVLPTGTWLGYTDHVRDGHWDWVCAKTAFNNSAVPFQPTDDGLPGVFGSHCAAAFFSERDDSWRWSDYSCKYDVFSCVCAAEELKAEYKQNIRRSNDGYACLDDQYDFPWSALAVWVMGIGIMALPKLCVVMMARASERDCRLLLQVLGREMAPICLSSVSFCLMPLRRVSMNAVAPGPLYREHATGLYCGFILFFFTTLLGTLQSASVSISIWRCSRYGCCSYDWSEILACIVGILSGIWIVLPYALNMYALVHVFSVPCCLALLLLRGAPLMLYVVSCFTCGILFTDLLTDFEAFCAVCILANWTVICGCLTLVIVASMTQTIRDCRICLLFGLVVI